MIYDQKDILFENSGFVKEALHEDLENKINFY